MSSHRDHRVIFLLSQSAQRYRVIFSSHRVHRGHRVILLLSPWLNNFHPDEMFFPFHRVDRMQNARDFLVSHRDHIDVGVIMDLNQSFYKLPKCLWYYFGMFNFELNPILNKMKCQVLF